MTAVNSIGPVTQPDFVSVPGSLDSELGCTGSNAGDWQPDCADDQMTLDPNDGIWKATFTLPAGDYEYKAAINKSWDENYGLGAVRGGPNIPLHFGGGTITFYYDHSTHWITSDAQGPIVTAPGSMQSELGCMADWQPQCMNPWLQDPDGDGTYTYVTDQLPPGNYEFKVAHGLSWDENYGAGGVPGLGRIRARTLHWVSILWKDVTKRPARHEVPDMSRHSLQWRMDQRVGQKR